MRVMGLDIPISYSQTIQGMTIEHQLSRNNHPFHPLPIPDNLNLLCHHSVQKSTIRFSNTSILLLLSTPRQRVMSTRMEPPFQTTPTITNPSQSIPRCTTPRSSSTHNRNLLQVRSTRFQVPQGAERVHLHQPSRPLTSPLPGTDLRLQISALPDQKSSSHRMIRKG
jgi:hypothetical protein